MGNVLVLLGLDSVLFGAYDKVYGLFLLVAPSFRGGKDNVV